MKKTMNTSEIAHELIDDGNANWSRAGAFALAQYLEELEESTGEEMEFDHVAIRCEWSEYDSLLAFAEDYFADHKQAADALGLEVAMSGDEFEEEEWEVENAVREYIEDHGTLIEFDFGIIVSSF
jgi:flavin-dependent dehydrogenase